MILGKMPDITLCTSLLVYLERKAADPGLACKIIADKGFRELADALPESYVRMSVRRSRKGRDSRRRDLCAPGGRVPCSLRPFMLDPIANWQLSGRSLPL